MLLAPIQQRGSRAVDSACGVERRRLRLEEGGSVAFSGDRYGLEGSLEMRSTIAYALLRGAGLTTGGVFKALEEGCVPSMTPRSVSSWVVGGARR
jgi:hypothetical protein